MQAIYNWCDPLEQVVESEGFKMPVTPELARFVKVQHPSEVDSNLVKSEVFGLIYLNC